MCLTFLGDDYFSGLVLQSCDNKNPFQDFSYQASGDSQSNPFMKLGRFRTKYGKCLEMDVYQANLNYRIFLHPACKDTWEILENGVLKNIGEGKCVGMIEGDESYTATIVECSSSDAETWIPSLR